MPLFPPSIPNGTSMGQLPVWDQTARQWRTLTNVDGFEPALYRIAATSGGDVQSRAGNLALGWTSGGRFTLCDFNFNTQATLRHATVNTVDATVTTLFSESITGDATNNIFVQVVADQAGGASSAGYLIAATVKRTGGGIATLVGAVTALATHEDIAAWACTIDVDGASAWRIRVTGAAAVNINWRTLVRFVSQAG